jgi:heptosyltransferase-2
MALPALRELRRIFADSLITLAARTWVAGLFEGEGLADRFVPVRDNVGFFNRARHSVNDAWRLRSERFDYAVLLPNSFGSALAARVCGATTIAGYPTDGRRFLLNHIVPFEPQYKTLHQVRYYLNIAAEIETRLTGAHRVDFDHCEPHLHVNPDHQERTRFLLERFGLKQEAGDRSPVINGPQPEHGPDFPQHQAREKDPNPIGRFPILAVNPGATNSSAKRWPADRFAETADRFNREGFQTVIVGTQGDRDVAEEVARLMTTPAVLIAGETSIAELKAVLACAALVISNDTGAAHVSAALGVPTVVVFGPTEHIATRPLSNRAAVVRHNVECSPCMLRECPIDHRCMTGVEVEDVHRAARQLLALAI